MEEKEYLSTRDVLARIPHKKSWLWAAVAKGKFPEPLRLGGRCYWLPEQIAAYKADLIAAAGARQSAKTEKRSAA